MNNTKKDTGKLLEELRGFDNFESFMQQNSEQLVDTELCEYVSNIIKNKRLNKSEVIKKAEMGEAYAYQIISGIRKAPARKKVICLAFGMELSLDETQEMLKKTGYAPLYAKNAFDSVVIYGLAKHLSVVEVNDLLYEYTGETL